MAFSDFKNVEQVLAQFPLQIERESFLPSVEMDVPPMLAENLKFILKNQAIQETEMFLRESFIFPLLQEAWKQHPKMKLWVNQPLFATEQLFGEPDYLVSASTKGEIVTKLLNKPLLVAVEAKKQDFEAGWAQCLAEMIACQIVNANPSLTIYGIVSTGSVWEVGKLTQNIFTRDPRAFTIAEPQRLLGILGYIFQECENQL